MKWNPISTAPKDRAVLLLIDNMAIQGKWHKHVFWDVVVLPSHGCGCCRGEDKPPTHWMELPTLPKENRP